jgi:hypothetical protein
MSLPAHLPSTSRTCKSTAISSLVASHPSRSKLCGRLSASAKALLWVVVALLPLSGCTSVRPIHKIGLIAPFEGLYRQSGYAALEAMRQAIADCTPNGYDVLPLALDDGGDPAQAQRAAQKILVDPSVVAVVGPLLLENVPAVATVITPTATVPWLLPSLLAPSGDFAIASANASLQAQVEYVAAAAAAERVLLLGLPEEWPWPIDTAVPTLRVDDLESALATATERDAMLWLGQPHVGATWFAALRAQEPDASFWLANQAGMDVFAAHAAADNTLGGEDHQVTHWLLWIDSEYNQRLQPDDSAIQPNEVVRYSTYRATCAALYALENGHSAAPSTWQIQSQPVQYDDVR